MSIIIDGKEYYGIIYKIENMITHAIYIGQTTHPRGFNGRYFYKGVGIERVYKDLKSKHNRGASGNIHLLRSIEKCGFDAFKVDEVFDTALTFEELNQKEAHYINMFDSYKNGYNMTSGGDSISGYKRPSGKDCKNSKAVCQISLDGQLIKIWGCASDAVRELGVCQVSICDVCKGHRTMAGGFVWVYAKNYNPENNYSVMEKINNPNKGEKPVLWLSDDNEIIQEFYSVCNAGEVLGISKQEVSRICSHKAKTIKFNLMYKSEYMEEQRLNVRGLYEEAS